MKPNYKNFYDSLKNTPLESWLETLPPFLQKGLDHGDAERWLAALQQLPEPRSDSVELGECVKVVGKSDPQVEALLRELHPWRKGPYSIHGVHIDTEWRSDWKWDRIAPHISSLQDRTVLDVGCGNGYHLWRMLGAGAKRAIGIDPAPLFNFQFFAIQHFIKNQNAWVLPVGIEDLPLVQNAFDTVFSMGVLYHRKSPLEHIEQLLRFLRSGGELVLETLVIDSPENYCLSPAGRYAKMRNVWFIPSIPTLKYWLQRCGLQQVEIIDLTATTTQEQRSTDWMKFDSLETFLDPEDSKKTIEGYPAPLRATLRATKI